MKAGKLIFSDTCALHNIVIGGGIFPRIHRDQQRSKEKCQAGQTQLLRKTSRGSRRCSSWKQHEGTQRNHHEIVGQVPNFYFVTCVDIWPVYALAINFCILMYTCTKGTRQPKFQGYIFIVSHEGTRQIKRIRFWSNLTDDFIHSKWMRGTCTRSSYCHEES